MSKDSLRALLLALITYNGIFSILFLAFVLISRALTHIVLTFKDPSNYEFPQRKQTFIESSFRPIRFSIHVMYLLK